MRRAALVVAAVLAGCSVGPAYVRPAPELPAGWSEALGAVETGQADLARWWRQFDEPVLASLVEHALHANRDVQIAEARLKEARALERAAGARSLPSVSASGSAARDRTSENNRFPLRGIPNAVDLYQAGFDASWEMDLFGAVRYAREAAAADTERLALDREAVGVSVGAEVAASYLRLRGAQARLASLDEQIAIARETIQLVDTRVKAGLVSELDLVRAREILASLEARHPLLEAAEQVEMRGLGVLVGAQPDTLLHELSPRRALPRSTPVVPASAPASLLARRADLRAIERGLAAENARVGAAQADRYPRLALGLSAGLLSLSTGNLVSRASALWNAGVRASAPIYQGGALEARLAAAEARYEQASIRYQQAAVQAANEVESAAVRYGRERERAQKLAAVVNATEDARNLALTRYQGGLGDFLGVLDAQRQLFLAEDEQIASSEQSLVHLVSLYKALGGGWDPRALELSAR